MAILFGYSFTLFCFDRLVGLILLLNHGTLIVFEKQMRFFLQIGNRKLLALKFGFH